jgi:dimethylargininase
MRIAITRPPSAAIERCELTHLERVPISRLRAEAQHHAYEDALRGLGTEVHSLPAEPELPDAVFVEDVAVVVDECAIITRPGAATRRPECDSVARALAPFRDLNFIAAPGTLDGGDVLVLGRRVYVGLTPRTNRDAVQQLESLLGRHGYTATAVDVSGCLHLKSAVTQVAGDLLLVQPAWVDASQFPGFRALAVAPDEPHGANALRVGDTVFVQPAFPRTHDRLEAAGVRTTLLDHSELAKAEGALTCCSILFER